MLPAVAVPERDRGETALRLLVQDAPGEPFAHARGHEAARRPGPLEQAAAREELFEEVNAARERTAAARRDDHDVAALELVHERRKSGVDRFVDPQEQLGLRIGRPPPVVGLPVVREPVDGGVLLVEPDHRDLSACGGRGRGAPAELCALDEPLALLPFLGAGALAGGSVRGGGMPNRESSRSSSVELNTGACGGATRCEQHAWSARESSRGCTSDGSSARTPAPRSGSRSQNGSASGGASRRKRRPIVAGSNSQKCEP